MTFLMKNSRNPNLVEIGQKYRALHMKTKESFLSPAISDRHKSAVVMLVEKV